MFISPDWRGTTGYINFTVPLFRYGSQIDGISLTFAEGKVIKASAAHNEELLHQMIATENADKVGEFSLTDKRFSKITHFMGETLYDENIGGPHGNSHIALGKAYKDSYIGDDIADLTDEQRAAMGYNDSAVHSDMIHTADRTVTATLMDGSEIVIYQDGQFNFDLKKNKPLV